ncbi:hypothetical protein KY290_001105 [Solanum tuberosum]|uniref:Uncharacterized protein n=1 Tax=Solanum tuberosum TaxID=4113 RepID=A0ABQ7WL58_SOLTU|nr:hypothetical protein KY290_001105 [Solanum tuberosum]
MSLSRVTKKGMMSLSGLFPRSNSSLFLCSVLLFCLLSTLYIGGVKTKSIKYLSVFVLLPFLFLNYYSGEALEGFLAVCDAGRGSPSSPFYPPGREAQSHIPVSEIAPISRAILVLKLKSPLLPDIQRKAKLQHRLSFYFIGRNESRHLPLFLGILEKQFLMEKRVEAALVGDGCPPQIVLAQRSEIRNLLFNHPTRGGAALFENTLNRHLGQVEQDGMQQSVPYLKVLCATRYWV